MSDWSGQKKAKSLRPFKGQEMRKWRARPNSERFGSLPISPLDLAGPKVWHGLAGAERTALPLPKASKGPIRAREAWRKKGLQATS